MTLSAQFLKNLKRFRLITFDVTDTLLRFRTTPGQQYTETAASFGVKQIDPQLMQQIFCEEYKAMAQRYPIFGSNTPDMTWQDWWVMLVNNVFLRVDDKLPRAQVRLISETLLEKYRTSECWHHIDGNKELLTQIRLICPYMGIISNTDPGLERILHSMNLRHNFDFVYTSYDLGVEKPHCAAFQKPLECFGVAAQEALHIGNLYDKDYEGARNSGWCSLLVTNSIEDTCKAKPAHVFPTLKELQLALETTAIEW